MTEIWYIMRYLVTVWYLRIQNLQKLNLLLNLKIYLKFKLTRSLLFAEKFLLLRLPFLHQV